MDYPPHGQIGSGHQESRHKFMKKELEAAIVMLEKALESKSGGIVFIYNGDTQENFFVYKNISEEDIRDLAEDIIEHINLDKSRSQDTLGIEKLPN